MIGRLRGKTTWGSLSVFPLFVLVLLGVLLMHGGLSAHVNRQAHAPAGAHSGTSMPVGAMPTRPEATPLSRAGNGPGQRPLTVDHIRNSPDCESGHAGAMCLAFLRLAGFLTGFLTAVLLIGWAAHLVRRGGRRSQTATFRSGRSPPDGPPRSRAPSLASLCVLRL
ncbi:DUF6153 family protein [Frankia canadensis]|nr:DUF6153 family protein [Frankia canadensis]